LPNRRSHGFNCRVMTSEILITNTVETQDTLDAACSAMNYALAYAKSVRTSVKNRRRVEQPLGRAVAEVAAVRSLDAPPAVVRGHVANAVTHLRAVLRAIQELDSGDEIVPTALRSTARALALLYPLTQTEEPILLVARKQKKGYSRRRPSLAHGGEEKRSQLFEVQVGRETATNFFAGFSGEIASGGLFIATYDIHPVGTRLTVSARIKGGDFLTETAEVNWVREYNETAPDVAPGMGVVFKDLGDQAREAIKRFMGVRDAIFYEAV
jgi:uncharacterized protein (TIGR02266 family)